MLWSLWEPHLPNMLPINCNSDIFTRLQVAVKVTRILLVFQMWQGGKRALPGPMLAKQWPYPECIGGGWPFPREDICLHLHRAEPQTSRFMEREREQRKPASTPAPTVVPTQAACPPLTERPPLCLLREGQDLYWVLWALRTLGPVCPRSLTGNQFVVSFAFWIL